MVKDNTDTAVFCGDDSLEFSRKREKEPSNPVKEARRAARRERQKTADARQTPAKAPVQAPAKVPGKVVRKAPLTIDFDNLYKRVHRIKRYATQPFFSYDSKVLAFGSSDGTYRISIKENTNPTKMTDKKGNFRDWVRKGERLLWIVDNVPAHFTTLLNFEVHQNTQIADYQELVYLTAWGRMNNFFYDRNFHGADWETVKEKYREAARNAPTMSVFTRVISMMLGELNASHLGYYETSSSKGEWVKRSQYQSWSVETAHLGLVFDTGDKGSGWLVKSVVRGGPADRNAANIKVGERILSVDGQEVFNGMDPSIVLNGPDKRTLTLSVLPVSGGKPRNVLLRASSYKRIRALRNSAYADELRSRVHKASNGRLGYLDIKAMDWANYYQFEEEIFSEGFDKDGMIIDVRNNCGGFVADRVLNVLCGSSHSLAAYRDSDPAYLCGYWGRPVFNRPIVVLCNETTASNGEIFTHAIKALKRGKVVGVATGARVIATNERRLLDYGNLRMPSRGWFLLDGRDMEAVGAEPDVVVLEDLNAEAKGVDVQLNAAIDLLKKEVRENKLKNPPVKLKYFR